MTATLLMPRLGESMEEGTVSRWLVAVGQRFDRGEALIEFETDKTAVEYPALGPGVLAETLVGPGDLVQIGTPIARIDLEGGADWVSEEGVPQVAVDGVDAPITVDDSSGPRVELSIPPAPGAPIRATPLARRAARMAGVDLQRVHGTGRRGRIELADVQGHDRRGTGMASESWGPAEGVPVLLVHGFAGDRTTFAQLGKGLGRSGFRARAVELPGHGQTSAEAQSFDDLVDALQADLSAGDPVHLIGHSLGAAVAIKAAAGAGSRVMSLTLISPAGLGLSIDAEFVHGMARADSVGTVAHLLRRLSARTASYPNDLIAQIHEVLAQGRLRALAESVAPGAGTRRGQGIDVVAPLASLAQTIPVRIIVGHRDQIIDWRDALTVSPRIALHHFPEAGHVPHWDFPTEVEAIIQQGIQQHGE